jgi:hypothetical protein
VDSNSQSGPSPSSVHAGDDSDDYSEGEALSQEMAKMRLSRIQDRIAFFYYERFGCQRSQLYLATDYLNDPVYASQSNAPFLLPLIGPISMGIMFCSSQYSSETTLLALTLE